MKEKDLRRYVKQEPNVNSAWLLLSLGNHIINIVHIFTDAGNDTLPYSALDEDSKMSLLSHYDYINLQNTVT